MSCSADEIESFINDSYLDILDRVGASQAHGEGICLDCAMREVFALSAAYLRQTGHSKTKLIDRIKFIDQFPETQPDWAGLETCH